ncbi:MAG: type II CRISPR-associated endonuclease Cas1 [Proteobacteria bacterium]|nr:type II CRISPR-associated endonuclease Cas1 [Pseudomonadota bacterium]
MSGRIIEISNDGYHLLAQRGFMLIEKEHQVVSKVPLDDIAAIIGCAHGLSYTNNLLVELAKRNAVFVLCGPNFLPMAFLWSLEGNYTQSARMEAQLCATQPKSKQLWKLIVQAKIRQQAAALTAFGIKAAAVSYLAQDVKSGDPSNMEAQAARRYWPLLFGPDFRRDRDATGVNAMLNYGYTILRSATARSVMGAGLHPSLGLHHSNKLNAMRLVDDLMEPYRPFIDCAVKHLSDKGNENLTPETKATLAGLLDSEVATKAGMTAMRTVLQATATSLALIYEEKKRINELELPLPQPPLWQGASHGSG